MKKQLFLIGVVFISVVWLIFQVDLSTYNFYFNSYRHRNYWEDQQLSRLLINTNGCKIQDLDPFDRTVQEYIYPDKAPECSMFPYGRLVKGDTESIYIDWNVWKNISKAYKSAEIKCYFCEFWRVEFPDLTNISSRRSIDATRRTSDHCKTIENITIIEDEEFISVECKTGDKLVYSDFFAFPNKKNDKMQRARNDDEVNVLLVGLDSVSRLNLQRQMPKTVNFFNSRVNFVEMLGYNKIGDNTFPNLVAVLSGLTVGELTSACWQNESDTFDNCPLVWKKYKNAGYHVGYAEDSADIGLFNYLKVGFWRQPVDFYGQIFSLSSEADLGHDKRLNTNLCIGNRMTAGVLLEMGRNFAFRLKEFLTWGFFWSTSLSHDFLNLPRFGDQLHADFFLELLNEGIFNTSVVVFFSDHGIRWGGIRKTYQGYIEERLPFLYIAFPDWLAARYPSAIENLKTNRKRLTTPFDLHETLLDLINLKNIENSHITMRSKDLERSTCRGISLFLPISGNRNCKEAGITEHWCTCLNASKTMNINDPVVLTVADVLVDHLNGLLKQYNKCSELHLHKIHSAHLKELALNEQEESKGDKNILLVAETLPGNGIFEATIRYRVFGKNDEEPSVVGSVSRLNTYGNQSICITHYKLKLYCYCVS